MADLPPVLALVGPTGAGKSRAALAAAARLDADIVAVDAFTVYRDLSIGTAKPSAADRRRVPHHMVDVLDVEQECTVGWFQRAAREAIATVRDRGRVPLLVGGSGLYFRAVADPLTFPPTDPAVRRRLADSWRHHPEGAHAHLAARDPDAAAKIDPANLRRTIRALEVIELTGRPFSAFRTAWDAYQPVYDPLVVVGLACDREALGQRLDARVDAMLAAGWLEECRALAGRPLSHTAAQAIGYAELLSHLRGETDLAEAVARIKARTRRYAARQQRWFARDPRIRWVHPGDAAEALVAAAVAG